MESLHSYRCAWTTYPWRPRSRFGLLPTHNWRVGDVIADSHRVFVGRTKTPAWFTFYAGLFRGDKRMKVKEGPQDGKDRAKLGRLRLK